MSIWRMSGTNSSCRESWCSRQHMMIYACGEKNSNVLITVLVEVTVKVVLLAVAVILVIETVVALIVVEVVAGLVVIVETVVGEVLSN